MPVTTSTESRRNKPGRLRKAAVPVRAYYVYLLECGDGSIYTGITTDVKRRFAEHKDGTGSRFTRAKRAKRIIYSEEQPDRSRALKREAEIKKWPRAKKKALAARKY